MKRWVFSLFSAGLLVAASGCQSGSAPAKTIDDVHKIGGKVTVDTNSPEQPVVSVNLSDVPITDAQLAFLDGLTDLQKLDLGHTRKLQVKATITDAGLVHVRGLRQLQRLSLTNTGVTDAGLDNLKGLTRLKSLNLEGTKVSDAGLDGFKSMADLQTLKLAGTKVTPAGVKKLQESLPKCKISI